MTFWETVERGEYVMIALALFLIIIICIWWVRASRLAKDVKAYPGLMQRIRDHIVEGDLENCKQICTASSTPGSRVVEAGIDRIGKPMLEVKSSMQDVASVEKQMMGKGVIWLWLLAIVSPLLGLGGTLVGVIDRLRDLAGSDRGTDIASVCGAIAPTIVSTVSGLGVGIFALLALACLESSLRKSRRSLDEVSVEFTNLLDEPA